MPTVNSVGIFKNMGFFEKVYEAVKSIPKGKVASYGTIARMCGNPKMSRQVGWALHANDDPINVPCYRVVTKEGNPSKAFVFGGINAQIELLKADGIEFDEEGRVKKEFFI